MTPPLIMVVEDDADTLARVDNVLRDAGYRTFLWPRGKGAHLQIREVKPDLIFLDMWLEHPTAGEMALGLLELDPGTQRIPVIICSARTSALRGRLPLFRQKGYVVLEKPFAVTNLLAQVDAALQAGRIPKADAA